MNRESGDKVPVIGDDFGNLSVRSLHYRGQSLDDDPLDTDLIVDFELWDQPDDYHYQPDNSDTLLLLFDELPPNDMDADQLQLLLQGLGTTLENLNNTMAGINTAVGNINIAMGDIHTAMNGVNTALGANNGLLTTANQTNQALGTVLQTMTNSQGALAHAITNFNLNPEKDRKLATSWLPTQSWAMTMGTKLNILNANTHQWEMVDRLWIQAALNFLMDEARTWALPHIEALNVGNTPFANWGAFVDDFKRRFMLINVSLVAKEAIKKLFEEIVRL
ncbi:hypothetical protein OF83DRAFT_1180002 [Amylostereum chailletii]|nr:hypothetical protein OF83DRAFT_1180002 [Amylostereum chailletii]